MNSRLIRKILPYTVLLALLPVALCVPLVNVADEWIPLVSGFADMEVLKSGVISAALVILFISAILVAVCSTLQQTMVIPVSHTVLIFGMLLLSDPYSLRFNMVYPVLLCLVLMQFFLLRNQVYASFMIISVASLFYAPAVWFAPAAIILLPLNGVPDFFRISVKAIGGFITPQLYLLVFRWIKFNDAHIYLQHYIGEITDIGLPLHLLHLSDYFLIICVLYMVVRSISFALSRMPDGMSLYIIRTEISTFWLASVMFVCFYNTVEIPLFNLVILPAALLISYYLKNCDKKSRVTAEYLTLMCAILLRGFSHLVN